MSLPVSPGLLLYLMLFCLLVKDTAVIDAPDIFLAHDPILGPQQQVGRNPCSIINLVAPTKPCMTYIQERLHSSQRSRIPNAVPSTCAKRLTGPTPPNYLCRT